jgi:hypothetical protein
MRDANRPDGKELVGSPGSALAIYLSDEVLQRQIAAPETALTPALTAQKRLAITT